MIGDRIKALRIKQGLTQRELAKQIGLPAPRITEFERNRVRPRKEAIIALAFIFDIKPIELDPTLKETFLGRDKGDHKILSYKEDVEKSEKTIQEVRDQAEKVEKGELCFDAESGLFYETPETKERKRKRGHNGR